MEPFIPLISEVGFPIVVTLYLLYRIDSKVRSAFFHFYYKKIEAQNHSLSFVLLILVVWV